MINSLTGVLNAKTAGRFFLQCGPIEWEIEASSTTIQDLGECGCQVRVYTYLHHREDFMRLYGFNDESERALFLDILKVDGIGPKQALRILSGTRVERFVQILEAGDVDSLTAIPGLGIKTAQKIILALKGKLSLSREIKAPEEGGELAAALLGMGFDRRRAAAAVKELGEALAAEGLGGLELENEVFRRAIVRLSTE